MGLITLKNSEPGMVDALIELGRQRQQLLQNLRKAHEEKDLEAVLRISAELVGFDEKVGELPSEKSH